MGLNIPHWLFMNCVCVNDPKSSWKLKSEKMGRCLKLSSSWKRFHRVNKWLFALERRLHFCSWITAARLPVARSTTSCHQEDFLSPALITTKWWFLACTYRNLIIWESFRMFDLKQMRNWFFFFLSKLIWKLDRWKLSGLLNVFFITDCFLSTERYLLIFESWQKLIF